MPKIEVEVDGKTYEGLLGAKRNMNDPDVYLKVTDGDEEENYPVKVVNNL